MSGRETGPLEQYYDQKMLGMFTEDERSQLRESYCQLGNKFDEIVSFLKEKLGCSEIDAIEEAEQAINRWNEDVETFGTGRASSPPTPIQILLQDHYAIKEIILNIEDQAMGRNLGTED